MKRSQYLRLIQFYTNELSKIAKPGHCFRADWNPTYGGWRLEEYVKIDEKYKSIWCGIRNIDRMSTKAFITYLEGVHYATTKYFKYTRPF